MNFTNRQLEIIENAMKLIDEGGISNLTTKNLASKMEFSEPALYRHFKNKTEILNSVLLYYQALLKNEMQTIFNNTNNGFTQLLGIIHFQFQKFNTNPALIMVIFSETSFQNNNILLETISNIIKQKESGIDSIIKKGQKDGSIRKDLNSLNLANIFMGAMRFTALRWKLSGFTFSLEKEAKTLQQSFSIMIKAN